MSDGRLESEDYEMSEGEDWVDTFEEEPEIVTATAADHMRLQEFAAAGRDERERDALVAAKAAFTGEVDRNLALLREAVLRLPAGIDFNFQVDATGMQKIRVAGHAYAWSEIELPQVRAVASGAWKKKISEDGDVTTYTRDVDGMELTVKRFGIPPTCKLVYDEREVEEEVEEVLTPAVVRKVTKTVTKKVARVICGPEDGE